MQYLSLAFIAGLVAGGICVWLFAMDRYARLKARALTADELSNRARAELEKVQARAQALDAREAEERIRKEALERQVITRDAEEHARREAFEHQIISYQELKDENAVLKRDLQNIDVNLQKRELDAEIREQRQKQLDDRSTQLAKRYLGDTVKAVVASIGPSNFSACKHKLLEVIARCREIGFEVPTDEEARLLSDLRQEFEKEVRAAFQREEQSRIKAQIREEERLKREIDRELKQLERERAAIQAALDQALAAAKGEHTAEVERLQARLAEAEEKSKRTMSMAQQTKAGHVYVISNIGTFGTDVFKIGMTRRLEPKERVDELGSASVPFPFDVHMMIHCDDAPAPENALHKALHNNRVNRANPRKEFFKAQLPEIVKVVEQHHGTVDYVATPEALEYHQSISMSAADSEYIEKVYKAVDDEEAANSVED